MPDNTYPWHGPITTTTIDESTETTRDMYETSSLDSLLSSLTIPRVEPTLEEEYPECEFYRGVPVFRVGDRVQFFEGYETVVTGTQYHVIDDWLDNRHYEPRQIVDSIYYTMVEDQEDGESFPELLEELELLEPIKPKKKSGLSEFLDKYPKL